MVSTEASSSYSAPQRNWGWMLARGILAVLLGVTAIFFPLGAAFAATIMFAAFVLTDGVLAIGTAVKGSKARKERWISLILRGLLGIAIGVMFVISPWLATFAYAVTTIIVVAAWAMTAGILEIITAIRLRREIEGEWLLALSGTIWILLGAVMLALIFSNPVISVLSLGWVFGFFALTAGFLLILQAIRLKGRMTSSQAPISEHAAKDAAPMP